MKEEILKLREEGKTYDEIVAILGCSKSTVSYHCNPNSKEVLRKAKERRKKGIYKHNKPKEDKFCLNCGKKLIKHQKKFCSHKCQQELNHREGYQRVLDGDEQVMYASFKVSTYKVDILKEQNNLCDICGIESFWNGKELVFVLDHIDGNAANNKRDNLRCVCPNCDSQLDTYKSKNKNSARTYRYNQLTGD